MNRPHTSVRGVAAWLLACTLALGCGETHEPTAPRAALNVAVESEPTPLTSSVDGVPSWAVFSVDVRLANTSDVVVRLPGCGPALEQERPLGEWIIVTQMMCALGAGDAIELSPKSERRSSQTFTLYPRSTASEARTPGRFRLLYRFAAVGQVGAFDEARSAPFELK